MNKIKISRIKSKRHVTNNEFWAQTPGKLRWILKKHDMGFVPNGLNWITRKKNWKIVDSLRDPIVFPKGMIPEFMDKRIGKTTASSSHNSKSTTPSWKETMMRRESMCPKHQVSKHWSGKIYGGHGYGRGDFAGRGWCSSGHGVSEGYQRVHQFGNGSRGARPNGVNQMSRNGKRVGSVVAWSVLKLKIWLTRLCIVLSSLRLIVLKCFYIWKCSFSFWGNEIFFFGNGIGLPHCILAWHQLK